MDTVIIALLVGYESLAFAWSRSRILPGNPPLITEVLDDKHPGIRGAFVGGVAITLLDHLSLWDLPWL